MEKIISIRLKTSDINKCSYIAQKLSEWSEDKEKLTMTDVIKLSIRLTTIVVQDMDEDYEIVTEEDIKSLKKSLTNTS